MTDRARWALVTLVLAAMLGLVVWLVVTDAPVVGFVARLYRDKAFLRDTVAAWGWLAPLVFIVIQALQVIISPVPGEITGPVGGALFGTLWGVVYSTIGLTIGTLVCFGTGRLWGEPLVRPWLSEHHWNRMNFVIEAEGAILCFILYLIPGFPKDIVSYLFGISPMPFWVFAVVSTLGRIPGTWISSYFGAHVAEQQYIYAIAFIAVIAAVCLPLYYYRERIIRRCRRHGGRHQREGARGVDRVKRLDGRGKAS
ncbi:MAG: TVP38/TMEM64 family protein [Candidatus Rokubacteria bacterium]|nr:TVP38/TMEM64 family protein [Candidatus Rokubacteria bacterium]